MADSLELEFNDTNKRIGVLIAVMAGVLAFAEAGGNNASADALRRTVELSNTWAFFQAKTIRMTTLTAQAESLELLTAGMAAGPQREAVTKTVAAWRASAARYDSEPETGEGRKELAAKATDVEAARNDAAAANATYDLSSSALQLGILLASAAVVTGLLWLSYIGAGFGAVGTILLFMGLWAPHVLGG